MTLDDFLIGLVFILFWGGVVVSAFAFILSATAATAYLLGADIGWAVRVCIASWAFGAASVCGAVLLWSVSTSMEENDE